MLRSVGYELASSLRIVATARPIHPKVSRAVSSARAAASFGDIFSRVVRRRELGSNKARHRVLRGVSVVSFSSAPSKRPSSPSSPRAARHARLPVVLPRESSFVPNPESSNETLNDAASRASRARAVRSRDARVRVVEVSLVARRIRRSARAAPQRVRARRDGLGDPDLVPRIWKHRPSLLRRDVLEIQHVALRDVHDVVLPERGTTKERRLPSSPLVQLRRVARLLARVGGATVFARRCTPPSRRGPSSPTPSAPRSPARGNTA